MGFKINFEFLQLFYLCVIYVELTTRIIFVVSWQLLYDVWMLFCAPESADV